MKLNVFFRLKDGKIVEVQDEIDLENVRDEIAKDSSSTPTNFEVYAFKVGEIAGSDFFKDAEIIASSFGPLNL